MDNKELRDTILIYLKPGQENAIKKDRLAELCRVKERTLRLSLRDLIDEGYPICGSPHPPYGYFIANSPEEIRHELNLIRSYGKQLFRRYSALKRQHQSQVLQHPGQLPLLL